MLIGSKIRKVRELRGFSQEFMASKMNLSQSNYSRIEANEVKLTLDRLQDIAGLLDVDPLELISPDDQQVFNSTDQKGGAANQAVGGQIVINNASEKERELFERLLAAKDEEINALKGQLTALQTQLDLLSKN